MPIGNGTWIKGPLIDLLEAFVRFDDLARNKAVLVLITLLLVVPSFLWNAFAIMKVWDIAMVPSGLPSIRINTAIWIYFVLYVFRSAPPLPQQILKNQSG